MKLFTQIGGGLGDIFNKIYGADQFHVLPYVLYDDCKIDVLTTCCNNAVKDILNGLQSLDGYDIFDQCVFKDMYLESSDPEWYSNFIQRKHDDGYIFIDGEWDKLFDLAPKIDRSIKYDYHYKINYFEQCQIASLINMRYIVIHPSGGLQSVDGLSREQYCDLIIKLLDMFKSYYVVVIGASHIRDYKNNNYRHRHIVLEQPIKLTHERLIDFTNKASPCLSANIVKNASAMIGAHSCWVNMFWWFNRPTITMIPNESAWGNGEEYIKNNGCNWGFNLPINKCVIVEDYKSAIDDVLHGLNEMI